jgi:hypothetical protein
MACVKPMNKKKNLESVTSNPIIGFFSFWKQKKIVDVIFVEFLTFQNNIEKKKTHKITIIANQIYYEKFE